MITKDLVPTLKKEASTLVKQAQSFTIAGPKDMEVATEKLSIINKRLDLIEEEREKITKPLNQALKVERARWKPIETELEEAKTILRSTMSTYQTEQKARADAEAAQIAARIKPGKGNLSPETGVQKIAELDAPSKEVVTEAGSVQFRAVKKLVVTNYTEVMHWAVKNNVSSVVLEVNETALKDYIINKREGTPIEGAHIEEIQVPYNNR